MFWLLIVLVGAQCAGLVAGLLYGAKIMFDVVGVMVYGEEDFDRNQ
jgi:hypothetical protein